MHNSTDNYHSVLIVAMYSWQVFTDLLKALRKQLLTRIQQENDTVLCEYTSYMAIISIS